MRHLRKAAKKNSSFYYSFAELAKTSCNDERKNAIGFYFSRNKKYFKNPPLTYSLMVCLTTVYFEMARRLFALLRRTRVATESVEQLFLVFEERKSNVTTTAKMWAGQLSSVEKCLIMTFIFNL